MICPGCNQYVVVENPVECPICMIRVKICAPCFGTGQLRAIASVGSEHRQMVMIQCDTCEGRGLVKP